MALPPAQYDLVSRYLGLPQGYAAAGIPPAQPAAITMPVVEMGPSAAAPMPVVNPPPGASAMPVYSPPVNPDADALARQLGLTPPAPAPPVAPSSPVSPLAQGLQLPAGIAPPGTTPAVMAPAQPAAITMPVVEMGPSAAPRGAPVHMAPPPPAGPREPSWADKRRADEAAYLATFGAERTAAREANDAGAVVRDENAQALARQARMQEELAANEAAFQRDEAAARAEYRAQTQRQVDEVREMKVDPGRLYRDAGTWTGIMVAVGGALAGALSGFQGRGGENAFVDIINKNIDRDINAQVQAIGQKNASIQDRNSIYGQLVASHKDDTLARAQTRVAMLESARTHMEAEAQRLGTVEAQKRFEVLDQQMKRQEEQANVAVHGAEEQAAARAAQAMANARAAAAAARQAAEEKMFQRGVTLEKLRLEDKKIDKEHGGKALEKLDERFVATGQGPDGAPVGYLARNPKVAEERTKGLAGAKSAIQIIDTILARREKEGVLGRLTSRNEGSILGSPEWKTANKADHAALLAATKDAWGLGVLSGSDMELVEKYIGKDPNALDLVGDETNDRLRAAKARMQASLDAADKQEAGTRVVKVQRPDGSEGYAPRGGSEAPTNRRAVQRYDAQGRPLK